MIKVIDASKKYKLKNGELIALEKVSLEVKENEIFAVIGMSGAGKSTLLRSLAGLEILDEGTIIINGMDISKLQGSKLRDFKKNIGVVFQGFTLLNQQSVFENIAFPLRIAKVKNEIIKKRVKELLELVDLKDKENSYPSQLSGGQRQRVAIARAIATNPKVLLLDELTSALDPFTTKAILKLLKKINQEQNVTIFLITHHMGVVKKVADKVALIHQGRIIEQGTKEEVLLNPKNEITKEIVKGEEDE